SPLGRFPKSQLPTSLVACWSWLARFPFVAEAWRTPRGSVSLPSAAAVRTAAVGCDPWPEPAETALVEGRGSLTLATLTPSAANRASRTFRASTLPVLVTRAV